MAPRTSWKGFIKLSLVSVPVRAFTANDTSAEVRLNQLHRDCHGRVRYHKACAEHGELRSDEIVSGYEYSKNQYVVVEPDEVQALRTQADKSIQIDGFVPLNEVAPRYQAGKTYYLLPDGIPGERPYALLHRGMEESGTQAIAQVVISGREQLAALRPMGRLLTLSLLHYPKKVRPLDDYEKELEQIECSDEEMELTRTLIRASTLQDFKLGGYQDAYVNKLRELIRLKVEGEEIVQVPDPEEPKILNLMEALKRSVAEARSTTADSEVAATGAAKKPRRKMAKTSKKTAAKKATSRKRKSG